MRITRSAPLCSLASAVLLLAGCAEDQTVASETLHIYGDAGSRGLTVEGGKRDAARDSSDNSDNHRDAGADARGPFGTVSLSGELNRCPELVWLVAAPVKVAVGEVTQLSATASDPDGDPVTAQWKASDGTISAPNAFESTYTCTSQGFHVVTFVASDPLGCESKTPFTVTCTK